MKKYLWKLAKQFYHRDNQLRKYPMYRAVSSRIAPALRATLSDKPEAPNRAAYETFIQNYGTVPLNEKAILFESYWGRKIAGHPLALYREFIKRPDAKDFKIYWTLDKNIRPPAELKKNSNVEFVSLTSQQYGHALSTAKYLVNNTTFPTFFTRQEGQVYCNTWHGIPMKAMGRDMKAPLLSMANSQRNFLQTTVFPSSSAFYASALLDSYWIGDFLREKTFEVGSAGIDDVLDAKVPIEVIRERYGIRSHQKIVLLALTWRGTAEDNKDCYAEHHALFSSLSKELGEEYFVLFSAHQMVAARKVAPNKLGGLLDDNENINDILAHTDVLVSDYSSVIFDFLPRDKPIVFYTPDISEYRSERGLYVEPFELPGTSTTNLEETVEAIQAENRPTSFATYNACMSTYLPFETGNSAGKILDRMFEDERSATLQKPKAAKIKMLIAPGGLIPNGITSSLKNLLANLDYEKYDPYVLIAAGATEKEARRKTQFIQFDKRVNWLLWVGPNRFKDSEKYPFKRHIEGIDNPSADDRAGVESFFGREAARTLGRHNFDIAIEFAGYAPFWSSILLHSNSSERVIYQHNNLWAEATNENAARNQKQLLTIFDSYKDYDRIIAVSDETRDVNYKHLHKYYSENVQISTVRNTLDLERIRKLSEVPVVFGSTTVAAILNEPGVTAFLALGRLSPEKRFDRMIKAFARVVEDNPKAVLFICGSGPLLKELSALVESLGVQANVYLLGQILNPYSILKACNFCIMSSDYEGQPMVLLEAIALDVPCIGTDIPGIRAVLKDGLGTIVPCSEDGLFDAIKDAVNGKLPPHKRIDMDNYVAETMETFYTRVCLT